MPGILGTGAGLLQDVTLLTQIAILLLLMWGYKYVRDKQLKMHGVIMTIAILLHSLTIVFVMIPSFTIYFDVLVGNAISPGIIITWIHAIAGIVAELMGLVLVLEWRLRPPPYLTCAKRKWMMKPLVLLWTLALILGIAFYVYYYL